MKRFFDENGNIQWDDLKEAEKLIQQAFQIFTEQGYCHRDFSQFLDHVGTLCEYDYHLERY